MKCQRKWCIINAAVFTALASIVHADNANKTISSIVGDLRENPFNISSIPWQLSNTSQKFPQNNTDGDFKKCFMDPFKMKDPTLDFVDIYFRYHSPAQRSIKISLCSEFESAFLVIYDITESNQLKLEETAVYICEKANSSSMCTQSTKYRENMTTVLSMDIALSTNHNYVFGLIGFEGKSQESQFSLDIRFNDSIQHKPDSSSQTHKQPSFRHDKGVVGGLVLAGMIFSAGCAALGLSMWARHRINVAEPAELSDEDEEGIDIQSPLSPSRVV